MTAVQILNDIVVNQIAAGEVVERPSSVVKELVENSLDAGASEIKIAITNGGKTTIEVQDNGSGMDRDNALVAVKRFGTSKIRESSDLERIATLGFRGEALPSIASVSKFQLTTRSSESAQATRVRIEGGKNISVDALSAPLGTRVSVEQLFYNVPARKKFLRAENTETGQIKTLLTDFALAYPMVRFSLSVDAATVITYPENPDFLARVKQVKLAGSQPIESNEEFVHDAQRIRLQAVLCSPIDAVSSASKLRLIVNGRSVRDKVMLKAVRDGYGTYLRPGRHPSGVLCLELPPEEVDVNVHPQKTEVRFRNSSEVFRAVLLAVSRALSRSEAVLSSDPESEQATDARRLDPGYNAPTRQQANFWQGATRPNFSSFPLNSEPVEEVRFIPGVASVGEHTTQPDVPAAAASIIQGVEALLDMRYVGQLFSLYLLFEGSNQRGGVFGILDMHAAHERVVFFRLKEQLAQKTIAAQQLLLPFEYAFEPGDKERLDSGRDVLESLGFSFELNDSCLRISAVPEVLSQASLSELIADVLSEQEVASWERVMENKIDHLLARLACHGSVRSGRALKEPEVRSLLVSLHKANASGLCPHGRPVVRYFSEYEMEQFFGRVQ